MDNSLQEMQPAQLKSIFKRIRKDFMFGEYPPYVVLCRQIRKGIQKGWLYFTGDARAAYAICAEGASGYVLVSLFAVYPDFRGMGIGSAFLEEIKARYGASRAVIVEVERPQDAPDSSEKAVRERRMAFYSRAGFRVVPGVAYSFWDIPMHLMAFSQDTENAFAGIGEAMQEIYHTLLGDRFIHKMQFQWIK